MLQDKEFKTQLGKEPTNSFIMHILENRRYLGEYRYQDTIINDAFVPIITPELFDKCQARRLANKQKSASFKGVVKEKYILSDKLYCGLCGMNMAGESGKSSTRKMHRYYKCRNAKKFKTCAKKAINKQFIEDIVFNMPLRYWVIKSSLTALWIVCLSYRHDRPRYLNFKSS